MINMTEAPPTMRLQLALNVKDLDEAVDFYTKMFATEPAKRRPGYANFAIANPPLKLVLFEGPEEGTINHLGVETSTAEEVVEAESRLTSSGLETTGVDDTICCYAEKTETWVEGPDGERWEWYVKQADHDSQLENIIVGAATAAAAAGSGTCCAPDADATPAPAAIAGAPRCC